MSLRLMDHSLRPQPQTGVRSCARPFPPLFKTIQQGDVEVVELVTGLDARSEGREIEPFILNLVVEKKNLSFFYQIDVCFSNVTQLWNMFFLCLRRRKNYNRGFAPRTATARIKKYCDTHLSELLTVPCLIFLWKCVPKLRDVSVSTPKKILGIREAVSVLAFYGARPNLHILR